MQYYISLQGYTGTYLNWVIQINTNSEVLSPLDDQISTEVKHTYTWVLGFDYAQALFQRPKKTS